MNYVVQIICTLLVITIACILGFCYLENVKVSAENIKKLKLSKSRKICILGEVLLSAAAIFFVNEIARLYVTEGLKEIVLIEFLFLIAIIDFKLKKIPNIMLLTMLIIRIILYVAEFVIFGTVTFDIVKDDLIAVLIIGGFFLLVGLIIKNSVGMGDIKLFAIISLYQGFRGAFSTVFFALVVSWFVSVGLLLSKKKHRKDTMAFAPCAFLGVLIEIILTNM